MNKIISLVSLSLLSACASQPKCPPTDGFNSIVDKSSCKVRIRNAYYADQLSNELKDKIKQGEILNFTWVPTSTKNQVTIPAHFEVRTQQEAE